MAGTVSKAILFFSLAAIATASGCTPPATVRFVSLHRTEIDPPSTDVLSIDAQEAYWWEEDGEINITIQGRKRHWVLGRLAESDVSVSLIPGPPPAGRARNYRIGGRESRILVRSPLQEQRLAAHAGLLGVVIDGEIMHGSFRIWVSEQPQMSIFDFLPHRPGGLLCFGTFDATRDPRRGGPIRSLCESKGWSRLPAKRPTATTPKPADNAKAASPDQANRQ